MKKQLSKNKSEENFKKRREERMNVSWDPLQSTALAKFNRQMVKMFDKP